jgi:hypothetical protein
LIVLTGKKHRTVVDAPKQYRKTVQHRKVVDSEGYRENTLKNILRNFFGKQAEFSKKFYERQLRKQNLANEQMKVLSS